MSFSLRRFFLGRSLANREEAERKIGALEGVPAMGLDGLGSASYGPEAALAILIPVGAAGLGATEEVMVPILLLLGLLYISYRQTIRAYPSNGGAYIVSRENLGVNFSLLAATALMIDYVLNVAVGISAGVGALTSALPMLHGFTLPFCLFILVLITLANLRGTPDAGRLFAIPTYLFIGSFLFLIAFGIYQTVRAGGHPHPVLAPPALPAATEGISLWLLLRAFSAGCTAMTGVEAISNGVSAFRAPVIERAHRTLGIVCGVLCLLLSGIVFLARNYRVGAMDQNQPGYQSILSQLAGAIVGHNWLYYVALGSVLSVLCLSANTSFVDFPRMCRLIAQDDFLPRSFAIAGRRLVFSVGIVYLTLCSGALLILFGGITDRLIPLFAIGAFLTFTLSQFGMVGHWRRLLAQGEPGTRGKTRVSLAVNAVGGSATALALAVIIVAKFSEGAWITILALPCGMLLLRSIKRYYLRFDKKLGFHGALDLRKAESPVVLVVMKDWNKLAAHSLRFALHLSSDVMAIHLTDLKGPETDEEKKDLQEKWAREVEQPAAQAGLKPPPLLVLEAAYREIEGPLFQTIKKILDEHPGRLVAVLIPEVIKNHWWQLFLHSRYASRLRACLLAHGGSRLVVINVPWHLEKPELDEKIEKGQE